MKKMKTNSSFLFSANSTACMANPWLACKSSETKKICFQKKNCFRKKCVRTIEKTFPPWRATAITLTSSLDVLSTYTL